MGPRVLVRHELAQVGAVEGPGIDHLLAMRVDDGDALTGGDEGGLAAAGRDFQGSVRHGGSLSRCDSANGMPNARVRISPGYVNIDDPIPSRIYRRVHGGEARTRRFEVGRPIS